MEITCRKCDFSRYTGRHQSCREVMKCVVTEGEVFASSLCDGWTEGSLEHENEILNEIIKDLRRELTIQSENNHKRNMQLDALHFVWCDGGCETGVSRWTKEKITPEIVAEAIRNTARLYLWYINNCGDQGPPDILERVKYWDEAKKAIKDAIDNLGKA